ncbi:MAG: zinc-dependent metalloprotease [Solirubrobacteraceae bacterium]
MPAPLIDWVAAEWLARRVAGRSVNTVPTLDLEPIVADAQMRVSAYTSLVPIEPIPSPEAVSRSQWVAANISSTRALMEPMLDQVGDQMHRLSNAAQLRVATVSTAEVGLAVGYMGKRVLGQYELVLLRQQAQAHQPRLLFVTPNLGDAITRFGADEREFITWVALHEVTHAVQFGGVPWLQDHLGGLVAELMEHAQQRLLSRRHLHLPSRAAVNRAGSALRHGDLIGLVVSPQEQAILDRAQAVMAVVEGHAEHVMDAVAPELLPSLPALRQALDARRRTQTPFGKLASRLLGMEMKMRQYQRGKRFCDQIVHQAGAEVQQLLFSEPQALPSLAEIEDPAAWLRRVHG